MQKAILYHHILQSVSTNLGDNLQNNTAMKMAAFTATLADVRLALGQAFLPILSTVLPVLTAFMRKIEAAFQYVSQFTRALFGYSPSSKASTKATVQQTSAVSGLGDAIKKTGKEAKKAAKASRGVAGFDEINQLADPASSSGGGCSSGGGGGGGAAIGDGMEEGAKETEGAFDKISKSVKNFVKKFKKFFEPMKKPWEELKKSLGMVWDSIKDLWKSKYVQDFVEFLSGGWDVGIAGVIRIVAGAFKILAGAIDIVNSILNSDFKKAWEGVKKILQGIWDMIVGVIEPIFPGFEETMKNLCIFKLCCLLLYMKFINPNKKAKPLGFAFLFLMMTTMLARVLTMLI
jgi:phage-related protein